MIELHVLIATYGEASLLARTLESFAGCAPVPELAAVHVVENGPKGRAEAVVGEFSGRLPLRYHYVARSGKTRALQHAIEEIRTGLLFFTDDDVRVSPDILAQYVRAARQHGPDAVYGGPVRVDYEDGRAPEPWLREHLPPSAVGWDASHGWPWFLGINYAAFAERVLSAGGFDPMLGPGALDSGSEHNPAGDEDDLQQRLVAAGARRVYLPGAEVWHWVPAERSTPAWALHRRYRYGLTLAASESRAASLGRRGRRVLGLPRWYGRVLKDALRAALLPLTRDPSRRFLVKGNWYEHAGHLRGAWLYRRRQAD